MLAQKTYSHTSITTINEGYLLGDSSSGKEKDSETGLSYFGARYYEPEMLNIWLSVDPMSDKYPSISPYAYCAGNPIKLVDPDGMDWFYNENTGQIYYNSSYSINELGEGGKMNSSGWKYLCGNGVMYNTDPQNEAKRVFQDGGKFMPNKFDLSTGNMLGYIELSLSGKDAENFANEHGFQKVPTQVVHYNSTYNQSVLGPGNNRFDFEMGEDLQLAEKYAFVRKPFSEISRREIGRMIQGTIEPMLGCVPTVCRERITYGPSKGGDFFRLLSIMSGRHNYVNRITMPIQSYSGNNHLINEFLMNR